MPYLRTNPEVKQEKSAIKGTVFVSIIQKCSMYPGPYPLENSLGQKYGSSFEKIMFVIGKILLLTIVIIKRFVKDCRVFF